MPRGSVIQSGSLCTEVTLPLTAVVKLGGRGMAVPVDSAPIKLQAFLCRKSEVGLVF